MSDGSTGSARHLVLRRKNAPYIWMKCPNGMGSWEFFDYLLNEIQVVGTPGEGFGACGEDISVSLLSGRRKIRKRRLEGWNCFFRNCFDFGPS